MRAIVCLLLVSLLGCGAKPVKQANVLPEPPQRIHNVSIDAESDSPVPAALAADANEAAPEKPPAPPEGEAFEPSAPAVESIAPASNVAAPSVKKVKKPAVEHVETNEEYYWRMKAQEMRNRPHTAHATTLREAQVHQAIGR